MEIANYKQLKAAAEATKTAAFLAAFEDQLMFAAAATKYHGMGVDWDIAAASNDGFTLKLNPKEVKEIQDIKTDTLERWLGKIKELESSQEPAANYRDRSLLFITLLHYIHDLDSMMLEEVLKDGKDNR